MKNVSTMNTENTPLIVTQDDVSFSRYSQTLSDAYSCAICQTQVLTTDHCYSVAVYSKFKSSSSKICHRRTQQFVQRSERDQRGEAFIRTNSQYDYCIPRCYCFYSDNLINVYLNSQLISLSEFIQKWCRGRTRKSSENIFKVRGMQLLL